MGRELRRPAPGRGVRAWRRAARAGFSGVWRPLAAAGPRCDSGSCVPAMDPQKEARTPRDPVARPPASRSQTPEEEERRESGEAPAAAPGEEADASADGLWELPVEPVEPAERRPECSRCR